MKPFPTVSIITCSYNCNLRDFQRSLEAIKLQDYPKKNVEHIVMDGGSTNDTVAMAKKYGCIVYSRPDLLEFAQVRTHIALRKAKHDLILILEPDNIIVGKHWLKDMVLPYLENDSVFCTFSIHNTFKKEMPITTRYAALFGSPEPTLYYLKKSEKIRMDQNRYDKGTIIGEKKKYILVKFRHENLPTLGDNGHMFLRSAVKKVQMSESSFTHTDMFAKMMEEGYDTFGVVKNSIIHISNRSIVKVIQQRVFIKQNFYDKRRGNRHYLVYNPRSKEDKKNLLLYIFFSLTIIEPFFESVRGYVRIRDSAWFLHPIMCFAMVFAYGLSEMRFSLTRKMRL